MTAPDNTTLHTDIKPGGWIARLPAGWRPYALLARLDRPVGIWLLLLPGWWAIALAAGGIDGLRGWPGVLMFLFAVGAIVMRAAGCAVNDLWDRQLDAQVARTKIRPLAAGTITPRQAFVFLFCLLVAGFVILLTTRSPATIVLGFLTLPLIGAYPLMKRITWWPQLFLGIVFNFGALMGWAAVTGAVPAPALALYIGGIFWTLGYDTIYAHQDREDDARIGIKSTARRLGPASRPWVAGFYAMAFAFVVAAFVMARAGTMSYGLLSLAAAQFVWQVRTWDMDDPESCLRVFRSNRDWGVILLAAALL